MSVSTLKDVCGTSDHRGEALHEIYPVALVLRYAGPNIRMRQSGTCRGQYRITKKRRPLLRKLLSQIVLPLVRHKCLYGDFYHRKRLAMPGQKAMVVVMTHFLRKLHGGHRSGQAFDIQRYLTAASQLQRQAA